VCIPADSIFSQTFLQRVVSERGRMIGGGSSMDVSCPGSPIMTPSHHSRCSTTVLILVLHAGSVLGEWDLSRNEKINFVIKCYIDKI
jgi:hypothetical protein